MTLLWFQPSNITIDCLKSVSSVKDDWWHFPAAARCLCFSLSRAEAVLRMCGSLPPAHTTMCSMTVLVSHDRIIVTWVTDSSCKKHVCFVQELNKQNGITWHVKAQEEQTDQTGFVVSYIILFSSCLLSSFIQLFVCCALVDEIVDAQVSAMSS